MSKITRKKRKDNFTLINNDIFKRTDLSWKAKGLLCHLISLPDDWQVYVSQLSNVSKDGKESTASGMKELIKAGYILRRIERDENGKFKGYDYLVSDEPEYLTKEVKPDDGLTENGKPENGEPATTNNLLNKELKEQRTNKKDFLFLEWKKIFGSLRSRKGMTKKRFNAIIENKDKTINEDNVTLLFEKTKEYFDMLKVVEYRSKKSAEAFLNDGWWGQDWEEIKKEHLGKKNKGNNEAKPLHKKPKYFTGRD